MNASRREIVLGISTAVVVLGALTWWMVEPRIEEWNSLGAKAGSLEMLVAKAERISARKPELMRRLDQIKALLPVHPEGLDLKPRMLQQVKQVADAQKVMLGSMRPKEEKITAQTGLSEQSIDCTFEGGFADFIRFLYDIESQGPVMAIRQAGMRSDQQPGRLKGTLSVDFAYARGTPVERKAPPGTPAEPPPEPVVPDVPAAPATNAVPVAIPASPEVPATPSVPAAPGIPSPPRVSGPPAFPAAPGVVTDTPANNPASAFPSSAAARPPTGPVPEQPPSTNRTVRIQRTRPLPPMPAPSSPASAPVPDPDPVPAPVPAPAPAPPQP